MSTLKEILHADFMTSRKAGDELAKMTLSLVIGEIQLQEKAGKTAVEFNDADVLKLITAEVKKRRGTAELYAKEIATNGDNEVWAGKVARETAEADLLAKYLPVQLSEAEVSALVDEVLVDFEAPTMKDFGQIMKLVVAKADGATDGKTVSTLVKQKLG